MRTLRFLLMLVAMLGVLQPRATTKEAESIDDACPRAREERRARDGDRFLDRFVLHGVLLCVIRGMNRRGGKWKTVES